VASSSTDFIQSTHYPSHLLPQAEKMLIGDPWPLSSYQAPRLVATIFFKEQYNSTKFSKVPRSSLQRGTRPNNVARVLLRKAYGIDLNSSARMPRPISTGDGEQFLQLSARRYPES